MQSEAPAQSVTQRFVQNTFVNLSKYATNGIGRLLFGRGPAKGDSVEKLAAASKPFIPAPLVMYRTTQWFTAYYFRDIMALLVAGVLLVIAVATCPISSGVWLRFASLAGLVMLAGYSAWSYTSLDRDKLLSRMLGSPDGVSWNWSMALQVGSVSIVTLITLLAQVAPDSMAFLKPFIAPIFRLGK